MSSQIFRGCYTALITPMDRNRGVDYESLRNLVEFQAKSGTAGIVAVGTTGESPTLTWEEHDKVIEKVSEHLSERGLTIGGTGSNCTEETLRAMRHVHDIGVKAALLVDPYYNGPSSLEIRKEYIEPVAIAFPEVQIIPYVIPGRTGTQLLPQDIAVLHTELPNVNAVKEATGELANMKLTRKLCGEDFDILSGDDALTYEVMSSPDIRACGVISVISNIAPRAVQQLTQFLLEGELTKSLELSRALAPLFDIVTVKTVEATPYGPVAYKARNPLPCKTLMNLLGMPSGPCRRPLGRMTRNGLKIMLSKAREVHRTKPEIFEPIEKFFDIDLNKRLYEERFQEGLSYD